MTEAASHIARTDEYAEKRLRHLLHMRKDAIQAELVIDAEKHLEAGDDRALVREYSISVYALASATTLLEHAFKTIQALEADLEVWEESA